MNTEPEVRHDPPLTEQPVLWEKTYRDRESASRAARNHEWLRSLAPLLRLPDLVSTSELTLRFERLDGRHVEPTDLETVASHLGDVHAAAHRLHLQNADLGQEFVAELPGGRRHRIPGFLAGRLDAVVGLLDGGTVPQPLLDTKTIRRLMTRAATGLSTFYKDSNPRNLLVADEREPGLTTPATIDFDDLTLAPFGYDLAKLVVGTSMTCGPISDDLVATTLRAYNTAVHRRAPDVPLVTMTDFLVWTETHHVLTCRYLGRNGYRYSWHQTRPTMLLRTAQELQDVKIPRLPTAGASR